MVEDILTSVVQIAGNLTGMAIKYGAIMALPGVIGALAVAPITLMAAGITAVPSMIFAGIALMTFLGLTIAI
jgi:hypothetical protein